MIYNIHTFSVKYIFVTRLNFENSIVNAFAEAAFQRCFREKVFSIYASNLQ